MKNFSLRRAAYRITPFLSCLFLLTCGIEDYPYIYPIPTGNITLQMNSRVSIVIPNSNLGNMYFTNFALLYRIYISDIYEPSPSESNLNIINSSLSSDHSRVKPYIDNDSIGSSSIESLFRGINYYAVELEGTNIETVLSSSTFNRTLIIDFTQSPGSIPYLTLGTTTYRLIRSNDGGSFECLPGNRYFTNSPDVRNLTNINDTHINVDVTDKSTGTDRRYTYVSLYIVAVGFDPQTYVQLYSTPAFAGVLCLPD